MSTMVVGGTPLMFATYLNIVEQNGIVHAFLCDHHNPDNQGYHVVTQDMDRTVWARQRVEMRRFFELSGKLHTLGTPNVMEP
jgi:hypothetical protein